MNIQSIKLWKQRQNPWKLAGFALCIYALAALEYFTSLSHPVLPRWMDVVPDIINTVAVVYMFVNLFLKK